jgi:hypothetical protein
MSITSANAIIMLSVPGLFDSPQQLQGFAADDIFDAAAIKPAETSMGLDGRLSAGWIPVAVTQSYTLQADSPSVAFFEAIYNAQQAIRDIYRLSGLTVLSGIGISYNQVRGVLTNYTPMPSGKKMLMPRTFSIEWETVTPVPQ